VQPGQRAVHADGGLQWEPSTAMALALSASVGLDLDSQLMHLGVGPELAWPRLFGRLGGLSIGVREELGWLWAHTGWAQLVFRVMNRVRLLVRPSLAWQADAGDSAGLSGREAGLSVSLDVALPWSLWLRVGATGRMQADDLFNEGIEKRQSGLASAQLGGAF